MESIRYRETSKIGRVVKVLEDVNRLDPYSREGETRKFPISLFYPTGQNSEPQKDKASLLSLFDPAAEQARNVYAKLGISEDALTDYVIPVAANAEPDAHRGPLPVVIFSPGFGVDRDLYMEVITAVIEAGCTVVTLGVPYDCVVTVFPDGRVIEQPEETGNEDKEDLSNRLSQIATRAHDMHFVMEQLAIWNETDDVLRGMFDVNRIALMGHSIGGATAHEVATTFLNHATVGGEPRVRCVVLLDGSMHLLRDAVLTVPVLNLRQEACQLAEINEQFTSDASSEDDKRRREQRAMAFWQGQKRLYHNACGFKSFVKVIGANHMSFSTLGGLIGELPLNVTNVIQRIIVAFLRAYLGDDEHAYGCFLCDADRPAELIPIDGTGLPLEDQNCKAEEDHDGGEFTVD